MLTAVAVFGCCMLGFALSTNFLLSLALLAMSGMADNVSVVLRSTLLQTLPPREMLGRVAWTGVLVTMAGVAVVLTKRNP